MAGLGHYLPVGGLGETETLAPGEMSATWKNPGSRRGRPTGSSSPEQDENATSC